MKSRWITFAKAWWITSHPVILVFMNVFIGEMEGDTPLLAATRLYPQLEANTQQIMDYYDTCLENAIDHDNYLEFQQALSDIGEALEARFALEDKLIALAVTYNLKDSISDNIAPTA
nr:Regulator of sigma D [Raoultella sp. NCTC 9187]